MKLDLYQVDAFTNRLFSGNPAAVCPLNAWLDDEVLRSIAMENNLSETAFYVETDDGFELRWFTPLTEVDLCGHATLATAHVLFNILNKPDKELRFATRSGELKVKNKGQGLLEMDFPAMIAEPCVAPQGLIEGLGNEPSKVLAADDYVAVFENENDIHALAPDFNKLKKLDRRGVIATAPGKKVDFVSRFFAPKFGIDEDPVTGSAHCILTPYWSSRLGKQSLEARQVSQRGGDIHCQLHGNRVSLSGYAVTYMTAQIELPV